MSRAHAELNELALILARYLDREHRELSADPNPASPADPKRITHEPQTTPALVAEVEYSLKDAGIITHKAVVTLRKMIREGRLRCRKDGNRVFILGRELASLMAKQLRESPAAQDSVSEV